jgi:mRNA interferase HigB
MRFLDVDRRHRQAGSASICRSRWHPWRIFADGVWRSEVRAAHCVRRGFSSYPKASILKAGRVVFNIKGNDCRLVAAVQYRAGALAIRFFGSHAEYDRIDAETV